MLPTSSLDLASEWECLGVGALGSGCGAIMEAEAVVKLEEQVDKALEEVKPISSVVTALTLEGSARVLMSCFLLVEWRGGVDALIALGVTRL